MRATRTVLVAVVASVFIASGCDNTTGPAIQSGSVKVTTSTASSPLDVDVDGYTVSIDDASPQSISSNAEITLPGIVSGSHLVRLSGLAPNCSVNGDNPRAVIVSSVNAATTSPPIVSFSVTCAANTGKVKVTVTTSGADQDTDGYSLSLAGLKRDVTPNSTFLVEDVRAGRFDASIIGVSGNCSADKISTSVQVAFGRTSEVAFAILCVPSGSIRVVSSTSGEDPDPDGYRLSVRLDQPAYAAEIVIPPAGSTTITALRPGTYSLILSGLALNCDPASANPLTIVVTAGNPTPVNIEVVCQTVSQIAFVRGVGPDADIWVVNANGTKARRLTSSGGADFAPAWSRDGTRIVFESDRSGGDFEVYVMNADGSDQKRITNVPGRFSGDPSWSPDGKRIVFSSWRDGNLELYTMNPDGSGVVRLTNNASFDFDPAWSPDGRKIVFGSDRSGINELYTMNPDGSNQTRLMNDRLQSHHADWSPDGTRIAFTQYSNGSDDLYVVNADGSGARPLLPTPRAGAAPKWSPDGRRVAFNVYASCSGGFDYYGPSCSVLYVANLDGTLEQFQVMDAYQAAWRR